MKRGLPNEAMVLAAGLGERLRPLTNELPKPLFPLFETTLIESVILYLKQYGIKKLHINLYHLGEQICDYLKDGTQYGVEICYSREQDLLGTGGGIQKMVSNIESEHFFCVNSDTIACADLEKLWDYHYSHHSMATMALSTRTQDQKEALVHLDGSGQICKLLGRQRLVVEEVGAYCFTGTHLFQTDFLKQNLSTEMRSINLHGYANWIENDLPIFGVADDHHWMDLGTPKRYFDALIGFINNPDTIPHWIRKSWPENSGDIGPEVYQAQNVTLGSQVEVTGPCYIGSGTQIEDSCQIGPNAFISPRCTIGAGSKLSDCIVVANASVKQGSTINRQMRGATDSVVVSID